VEEAVVAALAVSRAVQTPLLRNTRLSTLSTRSCSLQCYFWLLSVTSVCENAIPSPRDWQGPSTWLHCSSLCCKSQRPQLRQNRVLKHVHRGSIIQIIATVVRECGTIEDYEYYDFVIAINIFTNIGYYLLLCVTVYGVNSLLRKSLGTGQGLYKMLTLFIVVVMGLLTGAYIGLSSYTSWQSGDYSRRRGVYLGMHLLRLMVAYYALYLVSAVASGALALFTLNQLRRKHAPVGVCDATRAHVTLSLLTASQDFILWVSLLTFCMFFPNLLTCIQYGDYLSDSMGTTLSVETIQAFAYLGSFFTIFSYVTLLYLAKCSAWEKIPADNPIAYQGATYTPHAPLMQQPEQQYGYSAQSSYQQPPMGAQSIQPQQ
jgi:hypothetical protein